MSDDLSVSIKDYFERLLLEVDRRYQQRFEAQERANSAALVATEQALSLALQSNEKSSAAALEANKVLAAKAEQFADQKLETHNKIKPWVQAMIDAQGEKIQLIEKRISRFESREEGMTMTTKLIVGALSVIATALGIYMAFR